MAVPGKVKPISKKQHTTEPVYAGSDIALGITFQLAIGERRSIVMQTHVVRDDDPKIYNAVLDKIAAAMDRVEATYKLKELRILLLQRNKALADMLEDAAKTQERWRTHWTQKGKRGSFEPDTSQQQLLVNYTKSQQQARQDISALQVEIDETRKLVGET